MTRLFASLIDRARLAAPVLERRPRGLFEPPTEAAQRLPSSRGLTMMDEEIEVLPLARPAAAPPPAPASSMPDPQPARTAASAAVLLSDETAPRPRQTLISGVVASQEELRSAPLPPRRAPARLEAAEPVAGEPATARRARVAKPALEPPAPRPTRAMLPAAASIAPPMSPQPATPPQPILPRQVQQAAPARVSIPAAASPPPRSPALRPPAPTAQPALLARAKAVVATTPSAPPPAAPLQISIGRIEVRAEPAPPPQRHSSRPAPRLSLADYLERREAAR